MVAVMEGSSPPVYACPWVLTAMPQGVTSESPASSEVSMMLSLIETVCELKLDHPSFAQIPAPIMVLPPIVPLASLNTIEGG